MCSVWYSGKDLGPRVRQINVIESSSSPEDLCDLKHFILSSWTSVSSAVKGEDDAWWCYLLSKLFSIYPPNIHAYTYTHMSCICKNSFIPIWQISHLMCHVTLFICLLFFLPTSQWEYKLPEDIDFYLLYSLLYSHHLQHCLACSRCLIYVKRTKEWMTFVSVLYYNILWFKYIQKNKLYVV